MVLEYQQFTPIGLITFQLEKIEFKDIESMVFDIPEGYEIMTMLQLQEMMMEMGNGMDGE